jgi:hypothetical protein
MNGLVPFRPLVVVGRSGGIKNLQDSHDFLVMYEVKLGESDVLLPPWVYGLS